MNSTKLYQLISRRVIPKNSANFNLRTALSSRSYVATRPVNYYDTLGITRKATQGDIKTAYYKLSMEYHPDKNKGSEVAAQKFRDIAEAYEVLGNLRLRKLYDKGIIQIAGSKYSHAQDHVVEEEEDAQTKFYKSRMKKSSVPDMSGKTPIYDFDEWSRAHYGTSFERRKAAKERYEKSVRRETAFKYHLQTEIILIGLALCTILFVIVCKTEADLDVDKTANRKQQR